MEFIKNYSKYIDVELQNVGLPIGPTNLYDPLRYFIKIGGKRMRPMLTLLGAELFDLKKEDVINAAISIELFHNFTLIHDDIMDAATLRRGFTTIHHKWNTNTAILSGDVLMIKAYEYLQKQGGNLSELLNHFNTTAVQVCEGQQLDINFENQSNITIDEYIEMIKLKTSVLLGCALKLSAIVAGASKENQDLLYDFGVNIGIAFQIQDDILDLYADPTKFGKQIGGDITTNKKTILYLLALKNANSQQLNTLKELQIETDVNSKIEMTRKIFDDLDVRTMSQELMNDYYKLAYENLQNVSVSESNKEKLINLSNYLFNREV